MVKNGSQGEGRKEEGKNKRNGEEIKRRRKKRKIYGSRGRGNRGGNKKHERERGGVR